MKISRSLLAFALPLAASALPSPAPEAALSPEVQRRVADALTSASQAFAQSPRERDLGKTHRALTQKERREIGKALIARGQSLAGSSSGSLSVREDEDADVSRIPPIAIVIGVIGTVAVIAALAAEPPEGGSVAVSPYEADVDAADEAEVLGKRGEDIDSILVMIENTVRNIDMHIPDAK